MAPMSIFSMVWREIKGGIIQSENRRSISQIESCRMRHKKGIKRQGKTARMAKKGKRFTVTVSARARAQKADI